MPFKVKLTAYLSGLLIGCVVVWVINTTRDRTTFNSRSEEEIIKSVQSKPLKLTPYIQCKMQCFDLNEQILKKAINSAKLNMENSNQLASPCPLYAFNCNQNQKKFFIKLSHCEKENEVISITLVENIKNCDC